MRRIKAAVETLRWVTDVVADEWPRRFPQSGETTRRMAAAPTALDALLAALSAAEGRAATAETERDEAQSEVSFLLSDPDMISIKEWLDGYEDAQRIKRQISELPEHWRQMIVIEYEPGEPLHRLRCRAQSRWEALHV